jgi:hypothetical protein
MGKDSKVMNITDSKYYFNVEDKKNIYGLLNILENRFYIIDNDYELLKFTQFLFMRGYQWYTMVDLSSSLNKEEIQNNNCHLFGCLDKDIKSTNIDLNYKLNLLERNIDLNFFNYPMQEKIFFIREFLGYSRNLIENFKEEENINSMPYKKNLLLYKKFLNIILPEDKKIDSFISSEIENLNSLYTHMSNTFNKIIFTLDSIDLKNLSIQDIKNNFKDKLQNTFFDNTFEFNKTFTKLILDYLDE